MEIERDMPEIDQDDRLVITVTLNGEEVYRKYVIEDIDNLDTMKLGEEVRDMVDSLQKANDPAF